MRKLLIRASQRYVLLPRASGRSSAEPRAFVSDYLELPAQALSSTPGCA
ncbi:MAG: hypothetical protein ACYDA6_05460 [Solirubrobacteraceae bacterium]